MFRNRKTVLGLLALGLVLAVGIVSTIADPPPPTPEYADNEGPVFLIISFDPEFGVQHPGASETIMVNIGSILGGQDVLDTRFVVDQALQGITLPDGRKDPTFDDLATQDTLATVLGSFYALDDQGFHSVVPEPGVVDVDIQQAIFEASNSGALDDLIAKKDYPTTLEIVDTIAGFLPEGSVNTEEEISGYVFGSTILLSQAADGTLEGDGELFPYEPNSPSIFTISFGVDEDGGYSQTVAQSIPIKITSTINLDDKNGQLPVTIESGRGFDASDIDLDSLNIGGVPAEQTSLTGNNALVAKFSVGALYTAGVLTETTTELTIRGTYSIDDDGDGVDDYTFNWFGTDTVTVN